MKAVLLMAYGTPERTEDVGAYFTHIRGGRAPAPESVRRLQDRYRLVGGRTPLLDITTALARGVERELTERTGVHTPVYVGMKHWHPFIADVLPRMARDGVSAVTALALAPHYSRISIGGYRTAVEAAVAGLQRPIPVTFVDSWHLHPLYIALAAGRVRDALARWPDSERPQVVTLFSAHSLPERIRDWHDPYESQLLETCRAVAARAGVDYWRFAWQSAGQTGEPWLGPDVCDVIDALRADGARHVLSAPIGFVCDHLEIFYDIDHEARARAEAAGITLRRMAMPNADTDFVHLIATIAADAPTAVPQPAWAG